MAGEKKIKHENANANKDKVKKRATEFNFTGEVESSKLISGASVVLIFR